MKKLLEISVLPNRKFSSVLTETAEQCVASLLDASADNDLTDDVKKVISLAFDNVLYHGSSAREYEVKLVISNQDDKLIVELQDTGLPGDLSKTKEGQEIISLGCDYSYVNLSKKGRSQRIVFTLPLSIGDIAAENTDDAVPVTGVPIFIRDTEEKDFGDIAEAFYREMGFTYSSDVYHPDFLRELIAKDSVHALTAVTDDGRFAGWHVLHGWDEIPDVYEGGMAITNANIRKCGAFSKLMEANNEYFENSIHRGVQISCATTMHEITQKTRLKYGYTPCGFILNEVPTDLYKTTFMQLKGRQSTALSCHVIDHSNKTVYVPEEITRVLDAVYEGEKLPRAYVTASASPEDEISLHQGYMDSSLGAMVIFQKVGRDCCEVLRDYVHQAMAKMHEVFDLYISIDGPGTTALYEEAKRIGFFFTGVIPCTGYGDIILMVKPFNNLVDYGSIVTYGPFSDMLDMIKQFDPYLKND